MATHSSILAWRIPWTEEPGGLQSMRLDMIEVTEHAHTSSSLGQIVSRTSQWSSPLLWCPHLILSSREKPEWFCEAKDRVWGLPW